MTQAYPLKWPDGWPRAKSRKGGKFFVMGTRHSSDRSSSWKGQDPITMDEAMKRVRYELGKLGVDARDDAVVSTNLKLNLAGLPRGDQGEPGDPGVALYFQKKGGPMRVMAIDAYTRVKDNLAAIAATLEAMRAIERHGGAQILERAFTGFTALPSSPMLALQKLGLKTGASAADINAAFRRLAADAHPDRGGDHAEMSALTEARDIAIKSIGGNVLG